MTASAIRSAPAQLAFRRAPRDNVLFGIYQTKRRHCERPASVPLPDPHSSGRAAIPSVGQYLRAEGIAASLRSSLTSFLAMTLLRRAAEPEPDRQYLR